MINVNMINSSIADRNNVIETVQVSQTPPSPSILSYEAMLRHSVLVLTAILKLKFAFLFTGSLLPTGQPQLKWHSRLSKITTANSIRVSAATESYKLQQQATHPPSLTNAEEETANSIWCLLLLLLLFSSPLLWDQLFWSICYCASQVWLWPAPI